MDAAWTELTRIGDIGIFVILCALVCIQGLKIYLEYKGKMARPITDEKMASLVKEQVESYSALLSAMERFFGDEGKELAKNRAILEKLYEMHNVRRNGTYAWYPHPIDGMSKMLECLQELARADTKKLDEIYDVIVRSA